MPKSVIFTQKTNPTVWMDYSKFDKILRFALFLSSGRTHAKAELASLFNVSTRTINRYITALEDAGFVVNRTARGYFLEVNQSHVKSMSKLIHFSEEEAQLLYERLSDDHHWDVAQDRLIKKLHTLCDIRLLKKQTGQTRHSIGELQQAIDMGRQVQLVNYRSGNSQSVSSRVVEPFEFQQEYLGVWCFEPVSMQNKLFRLDRFDAVHPLDEAQAFKRFHKLPFTDVFRMSRPEPLDVVKIKLSMLACNLLKEEYPLSKHRITEFKEGFLFEAPVAGFEGVGRFVLGLPGEVAVMAPESFKSYLRVKKAQEI